MFDVCPNCGIYPEEKKVEFNNWLKANASTTQPPMRLLDTTDLSVEQSVERVADWVRSHKDE